MLSSHITHAYKFTGKLTEEFKIIRTLTFSHTLFLVSFEHTVSYCVADKQKLIYPYLSNSTR